MYNKNMHEIKLDNIIDYLWQWIETDKNVSAIKDTTKVFSMKYDCYVESSVSNPLSLSIFELSDKGELLVDDVSKLIDSKAAYFLFVNTEKNFMVMVKNTLENCKKLTQGEKIDNLKIKIIE